MEDLYATLLDENFVPFGDDFIIVADDFSKPLAAAKAAGRRCCIIWCRDSDNQQAYYGPHGCSLAPYWFN